MRKLIFLLLIAGVTVAVDSWVDFDGSISIKHEMYETDRENKEDYNISEIISANNNIYLADRAVNIGFGLRYSTRDNDLLQDINKISINPKWKWGELHIWKFSPNISPLVLSGTTITGGGFELYPSKYRAAFFMGKTQKAINTTGVSSAYDRDMFALQLGFGDYDKSYIDLNIAKFADDESSLPESLVYGDTIVIEDIFEDSLYLEDSTFTYVINKPMENFVSSLEYKAQLHPNVNISGELGFCAFSSDITSGEVSEDDIPAGGILSSLFNIKHSTNYDFAHSNKLAYDNKKFNSSIEYSEIYPGFQSLGTYSIASDTREIGLTAGINPWQNKFKLNTSYTRLSDNLLEQNEFTNSRNNVNLNISGNAANKVFYNVNGTFADKANDSDNDTTKVDFSQLSAMSALTYNFKLNKNTFSLSLSHMWQSSDNFNYLLDNTKSNLNQFGLSLGFPVNKQLRTSLSAFFANIDNLGETSSRITISENTYFNFFDKALKANLRLSYSNDESTTCLRASSKIDYTIMEKYGKLFAEIKYSGYTYDDDSRNDFSETNIVIGYEYRF